jgi:hypothetical protein
VIEGRRRLALELKDAKPRDHRCTPTVIPAGIAGIQTTGRCSAVAIHGHWAPAIPRTKPGSGSAGTTDSRALAGGNVTMANDRCHELMDDLFTDQPITHRETP